jgi:hypothetical protein
MKTLLLLVTLLALGGCAYGHYWTKPGNTEADFKRDYYQCMKDFRAGGSKYARNLTYEDKCLQAQGYRRGEAHWEREQLWKP